MRRLATTIAGACAVAAMLAAPVLAAPGKVMIWITFYYAIPNDAPITPFKVVTFPFQVRNADAAQSLCASPVSLAKVATYVRSRHVELQGTLDGQGGKCATDKSGAIKMAVGLPAGSE